MSVTSSSIPATDCKPPFRTLHSTLPCHLSSPQVLIARLGFQQNLPAARCQYRPPTIPICLPLTPFSLLPSHNFGTMLTRIALHSSLANSNPRSLPLHSRSFPPSPLPPFVSYPPPDSTLTRSPLLSTPHHGLNTPLSQNASPLLIHSPNTPHSPSSPHVTPSLSHPVAPTYPSCNPDQLYPFPQSHRALQPRH